MYIVGGLDLNSNKPLNAVKRFKVTKSRTIILDSAPMDKGRIAFGLALNNTLNEFYVVGG